MKEILLAGEYIQRGQPVYIKDDMVYVCRPNDSTVDCVNHCDEMQRYDPSVYDCDFWEIICPLDLPNRKYCINYSPVGEVNTHD
jgi:hypothetical protein